MPPYTKSEEAKHDLIDIPETSENKKRMVFGSDNNNEEDKGTVRIKCTLY